MEQTIEQVREEFEAAKYHELKGIFERYQVADAFKAGGPKAELIEKGIKAVEEARAKMKIKNEEPEESEEDFDDEDPEYHQEDDIEEPTRSPELIIKLETPKLPEPKPQSPIVKKAPIKVRPKIQQPAKPRLRREDIERTLENIKLNLFQATEMQRKILLEKQRELEAKLVKLK